MKAIIIGAGKLGYRLADVLHNRSIDITLVDVNEKVIERVNDHLDVLSVLGNGTDVELLKTLDVAGHDMVILTTSSDETNILISTLAKKLGCPKTIVRLRNPEYTSQTKFFKEALGIDYVVNPDNATASEIVRYLLKNLRINAGALAKSKVSILDVPAERLSDYIGNPVKRFSIDGLIIAAVSRGGEVFIPADDTCLEPGDVLYFVGRMSSLNRLNDHFRLNMEQQSIRRVMVMGGGRTGYYLAQKLIKHGVGVTVIEKDKNRCRVLSEELRGGLIIHGDGTDINLLQEESMDKMDAFVGATEYDEQNILMALAAKQSGAGKAIAKISQNNFTPIVERLAIDRAFNPIAISIGNIVRFIHDNQVLSASLLLEGETEITELVANEETVIVNHRINEIPFPKWIHLGAVIRENDVILPAPMLKIIPEDRLILFSSGKTPVPPDLFAKPHKGGFFGELSNRIQSFRGPASP